MRWVVLPQAFRIVIPPIGNQFIGMLKLSALVSVIGVKELLLTADETASSNFRYIETLTAAGIWYLVLTTIFMVIQSAIERRLRRRSGTRRAVIAIAPAVQADPMTALLDAAAIWKRFGTLEVLKGVDLSVTRGRVPGRARAFGFRQIDHVALPEPAGADRRPAASCSRGRRSPVSPRQQAAALRRRMGMVFQNFELFPHLSADRQRRVRRRSG